MVDFDYSAFVIQQLRKRRQPWIYIGLAGAWTEVQIGTAPAAKTFAVF